MPPHLVAKAAQRIDAAAYERLHERLLRAYFTDNRDITREPVLRELWREVELPDDQFDTATDRELVERVLQEHNEALIAGASGVPAARMDGADGLLMGAHPAETYRRWVRKVLESAAQPSP